MSSDRKSAANRRNARKSRGPRTSAGKMRASRNAFRHGLAAISHDNPVYCAEIEQAAKAICEGDSEPLLFEQALIIAENDLILCHVRTQRIFVIERLRDATAIALAKGDDLVYERKHGCALMTALSPHLSQSKSNSTGDLARNNRSEAGKGVYGSSWTKLCTKSA